MGDENKFHWYDGWIYDKFIAPNQDRMFAKIKEIIEPNSAIIDVGCGTGRFAFYLSDKVKKVVAIDLSKRNIERANLSLLKKPNTKIEFYNKSLSNIISENNMHFDYAVMTYVIHEMDNNERLKILTELSQIADTIIIGDYLIPQDIAFLKLFNELVEFFAGKEHYKNYKSYTFLGGIYNLAEKANLKITTDIRNTPPSSHIAVLSKE